MLPKIQACIQFIENGGTEALITCPESFSSALDGWGWDAPRGVIRDALRERLRFRWSVGRMRVRDSSA